MIEFRSRSEASHLTERQRFWFHYLLPFIYSTINSHDSLSLNSHSSFVFVYKSGGNRSEVALLTLFNQVQDN